MIYNFATHFKAIRMNIRIILLLLIGLLGTSFASAQDTLVLVNNDVVVGDFKGMSSAVATIETDYSDRDFKIEWEGIKKLITNKTFVYQFEGSGYLRGTIAMVPEGEGYVWLTVEESNQRIRVRMSEIVFLNDVDGGWTDRLSANIAVGLSLAKANNLRQFNASGHAGYFTSDWSVNGTINSIFSEQDSAQRTSRTDASLTGQIYLKRRWFGALSVNYLSNDEINLVNRINNRAGLGKNWFQTNAWYFSSTVGIANNQEEFSGSDASTLNSWEAYFSLELNLFDTGDLNMYANFTGFPSLSDQGRFRYDAKLDVKYDLPYDFFVKLGTSLNFDNRPSGGADELDYLFQTSFGWEL